MLNAIEFSSSPESALEQELELETPPLPPDLLLLSGSGDDQDHSLELIGSDLLLGC